MECDQTHLNHNLLVSQKKKWRDYKGGFLYHKKIVIKSTKGDG